MDNENRFQIAIVGAGYMAQEHINAFNSLPNVQIAGIYSRTLENATRLAEEAHIPYVASSVAELYQMTQADLVVVAVTENALPSLMNPLMAHPWTMLIEKPVGLNLQQASDIYTHAKQNNADILVALNRRFYGSTQSVLNDLPNQPGKRFIHIQDQESFEVAQEYNYPEEVAENLMFANSIHLIDYFNLFARGNVEKINIIKPWNRQTLEPMVAHLTYDSGDEGLYQAIWDGPAPWSVTVSTKTRFYEMKPLETANFRTRTERRPQPFALPAIDEDYKPGLRLQAEQALLHRQKLANSSVTLEESMRTMKLIDQLYFG